MNNTSLFPAPETLQVHASSFLRDSVAWVQGHWPDILIAAAIAVAVVVVLHVIRAWGLRLCRRGEGVANWYAIFGRAVGRTGHFFIVMTAIRLVTGYSYAPAPIAATVKFLFTIAAVFQAAIWVREIVFGVVEHRTRAEGESALAYSSALGIIRLLVTVVLFAIALVVVLSNVGVNVTGLIAGLGVGGIAIGLAAQGIFADLFAALAILFDKPFRVGDAIAFDNSEGIVEAIGLKSTRIRGPRGEQRIIANKKLLDNEILNNSNRQLRRMRLVLNVDYRTSADRIARVPGLLREVVEQEKLVFGKAGFTDFAANAILFEVEFDSPSPQRDLADAAKNRVGIAILRRFEQEEVLLGAPAQAPLPAREESGKAG